MPYKNIVWIKLELRLINDHRFYLLSEPAQLIYIKILLVAAQTKNKIPKSAEILREIFHTKMEAKEIENCIKEIQASYPKLKEKAQTYYFSGWEYKTNPIQKGNPKEIPRKSQGNPKDSPRTEQETEQEQEEDKETEQEQADAFKNKSAKVHYEMERLNDLLQESKKLTMPFLMGQAKTHGEALVCWGIADIRDRVRNGESIGNPTGYLVKILIEKRKENLASGMKV